MREEIFTTEARRSHGSTVREASRQASSTAFSSEPVEESPRAEFVIAVHPELSRRTRPQRLCGVMLRKTRDSKPRNLILIRRTHG
jgi:hypothetical protein